MILREYRAVAIYDLRKWFGAMGAQPGAKSARFDTPFIAPATNDTIPQPRPSVAGVLPAPVKNQRNPMSWNQLLRAWWMLPLLSPATVAALTADIQGVRLQPEMEAASCVAIAGDYPGVRIEADQPGQTARICHNASRVNSISIANATLIATAPLQKEIVIRFEHDFPSGVNGKITARTKLQGYFATESGVGVPTGDKLNLRSLFSQGKSEDPIAEAFDFTVGAELDSAMFEHSAKKQYLAVGPRSLRGILKINFKKPGHKVTFPDKCVISLDTGYTLADKLDTMDFPAEEGAAPGGETPAGEAAPPPSPTAPRDLEPVTPPKSKKEKAPPPTAPALDLPPLHNPPGLEPLPDAKTP